ncbi:hypothetical protein GX50_01973 [[Emmonsia] crescens]|uniref:Uncharacterized protein n=1 Tax=[Emmonsia] crescens TaxID=73230 RepID=A0A2B7ZP58_9EURO|nr:hypothetical protein GX50_01973 [Emmonsia crescens]
MSPMLTWVTQIRYSGHGYAIWVWNALEINLAVICAIHPDAEAFARKYFPKLGVKLTSPSKSRPQLDSQEYSGIFKVHTIRQIVEHNSSTEQLNRAHEVKSYHRQ